MKNNPDETNMVFIVDDNTSNLDVLSAYLRRAGFRIGAATDGESALEKINRAKPDIILLDIMMPGIDGFETCRRLKANPETKDIPVIFMTALAEIADKMRGFQVGAVDYVTKPFNHKEVLARVSSHLTILAQKRELQASNKELDAFARTVAHELKAPLMNVVGYARTLQQMRNQLSEEDQDEFLQNILLSGQRMSNITDELLLLAKMREAEIDIKELNMNSIVKESKSRLAYMIEEHQAEVIIPNHWPVVNGYAPWVSQVWVNYMSNALKYGGRPPRVELGATPQEDGQVRFWVQDNGAGLTPDEQSQLFTEFTQLNQVQIKGYGLGLSIVRRIVERLGGEVGVESKMGEGSVFYFTLASVDETGE